MIKEYYSYLLNNHSKETAKGYVYDAETLIAFLLERYGAKEANLNLIKECGEPDLLAFIDYELNLGKSPKTINRKISGIKAFFDFLKKNKEISDSPAEKLSMIKNDEVYQESYDYQSCKILLDNIKGRNRCRDKAIIFMFLTCGLTVNEIISLKMKDIDEDNIYIYKNGKIDRVIEKTDALKSILSDYLFEESNHVSEFVFSTGNEKGLSKRTIHQLVDKHLISNNMYKQGNTTETLRKTGVALMVKNNNRINHKDIENYLGLKTTSKLNMYFEGQHIGNDFITIEKEFLMNNPLNKMI